MKRGIIRPAPAEGASGSGVAPATGRMIVHDGEGPTEKDTMGRLGGAALFFALAVASVAASGGATDTGAASMIEEGRKIALDRRKGNCMACHVIAGATLPGNVGPPLVAMKARFPDKEELRSRIRDSSQANPQSLMPPFGRHEILTEDEIDKVVEFVHSL